MKKIFFATLALVLFISACTPREIKSSEESNILFADDFTDPLSGWDRFQNDTGVTDYSNVGYLIYIRKENIIKWANPSDTFPNNVRIEVDASMAAGPEDNAFGLICRYQDPDNFYYFYISSDGFGGIGRKEAGQYKIISSSTGILQKMDGVNPGVATNHLRADCIDSTLTLYVNETQVAEATDGSFPTGNVGVIARSYDEGGTDIRFNNFNVYRP